jgi:hypothetical protein
VVAGSGGVAAEPQWCPPGPGNQSLKAADFAATAIPACHYLPMDQDDPEKRIADLERQLAEASAAGDPGTNQGSQAPPAWTPFPAQPGAWQPVPPPPVDWQNPPQAAPSAFSFPAASFPAAPAGNRGGRIALILLVTGLPILILVIVGIMVMSAVHQATKPMLPHSAGSQPSAAGPTQLQTPDGLNGLLAQIRGKFGDTMGYQLTVYPDYAVLERADPQNSQHKKTYLYKGGSWRDSGETEHVTPLDFLVDLGKFDPAAVAARMAGAAQPLNVPNPTSTYLIVEGSDDGSTRIAIYASGNGDDGYMNINPDGSVKEMHPQT